jgi:hypothetical protein
MSTKSLSADSTRCVDALIDFEDIQTYKYTALPTAQSSRINQNAPQDGTDVKQDSTA